MATATPVRAQVEAALYGLVDLLPTGILIRVERSIERGHKDQLCATSVRGHGLAHIFTDHAINAGQALESAVTPAIFVALEPRLRAALTGTACTFALVAPGGGWLRLSTHPLPRENKRGKTAALLSGYWDSASTDDEREDMQYEERALSVLRAANVGLEVQEALRAGEAALRRSEEKFVRFFDSSPIPLAVARLDTGTLVDVNETFVNQFGHCRGEAIGCTPIELNLFPGDAVPAMDKIMQQEGRLRGLELPITCKSGEVKICLQAAEPIELPDGPHVLISLVDISAIKRVEQQLRASEEALKQSQAVAHVGHWVWSLQPETVTWSDETARIFGLAEAGFSDSLDTLLAAVVPTEDHNHVRTTLMTALTGHRSVEAEFRVLLPGGAIRYVWIVASAPVLDCNGNAVQISGIVQDISERKRTETLEMQLQRQERLAAVGQLAAGIAHDFNNIMSTISIYAELTTDAPGLTERERMRVQTIIEQAQRATRMIRQILDFSRQAVYERQPLDLLPLLKEEAKLLQQTLPENIEIELDYSPGEYVVLGDPTRIQQLVMNLAVNARDAMPDGGQLQLALKEFASSPGLEPPLPELGAAEWVQLDVKDTGLGIRPEHIGRIFEPFFTTKEPGKGTGLGLAQAHGIVAQHDGYITVTSAIVETTDGKHAAGTVFNVFLPALRTKPLQKQEHEGTPDLALGHGECILVVEDDANLRTSLVAALESLNYQVVEAAHGEEALELLGKVQPNLILSDVVMPKLGGIALLRLLRQTGSLTPVVLMSGHPLREERVGLEALRMNAWLEKPPGRQQLAQAIADALNT